jgi:hypothetical protein
MRVWLARRLALGAMLALAVAGCGLAPDRSVQLLTYDRNGCYVGPLVGELVADPTYGTSVLVHPWGLESSRVVSVAWPSGYSGRYVGSEIEVVAPDGRVVAVTGKSYELMGGDVQVDGVNAWWACGEPVEQ